MQTAVEWFNQQLINRQNGNGDSSWDEIYEQAKQMEKEQIIEEIIGFQIYLHDQGYITNHDWDFEKEAIYYLHKNQIK